MCLCVCMAGFVDCGRTPPNRLAVLFILLLLLSPAVRTLRVYIYEFVYVGRTSAFSRLIDD